MELSPLIITLETAGAATLVTFFAGIGLALAVIRMKRFQGLADAVLTLPMVLPPTVVGFFPSPVAGPAQRHGQVAASMGYYAGLYLEGGRYRGGCRFSAAYVPYSPGGV